MSEEVYEDLRREREMEMSERDIDDGGPAFPVKACIGHINQGGGEDPIYETKNGMSLLDYFAGQVLIGVVTGQVSSISVMRAFREESQAIGVSDEELAARAAYKVADAMLAERKRRMGEKC